MRFSPNHHRHLLLSLLLLLVLGCFGPCSFAADSLRSGESISGDTTLVSSGGLFEFGLFAPENATDSRYYVGIWYYNITPRVVVWVGNRDSPFTGTNSSSTTIKLDGSGNLTVLEEGWRAVWASNKTQWGANATATIQDDGDLVVKPAGGSGSTTPLWRSFDEPTDVLLSGMRITLDRSTGASTKFTSWKTPTDPSSGNFTLGIDPRGTRQLVMLGGSGEIRWRSGVWDDSIDGFTGISRMRPLAEYGFQLLPDTENPLLLVFRFTYFNQTPMRFVLLPNGTETTYIYEKERGQWRNIWQQPVTECELYNFCGSNAICMDGPTTECQCLAGFASSGNGSVRGCSRSVKLRGDGTDGFREMAAVKLPDMGELRLGAASKEACKGLCLGNVTCSAYAYLDGEGCLTWSGDLVDMLNFTDGSNGAVLYLRVDPSLVVVPEDNGDSNNGGGHKVNIAAIVVPVAVGTILIGISIFLWWKYRSTIKETWKQGRVRRSESAVTDGGTSGEQHEYPSMLELADDVHSERKPFELPMFSFEIIEAATENFSEANELGKGGFGRVYKATLPGGENVAVKRLSKDSGQGQEEFKNEMILIAKLQHNNLVRLLGCCIQGDEKILIYEYMSNKSLDDFIFNPVKQPLLDWRKRFSIIEGVARGLLYLHRDSRLRIVHRDLKASNILLDDELNPKISDFGMARIFGYNQNSDSTTRVVGTYGYMSPEYAMEGLFSARSDVYSFGVLILEIISGHKNTKFRSDDYANLLGYAWQLWEDNRAMELVDPSIRNSCSEGQVLRCIHIALLCVQDRPNDRPAMWPVVVMLGSETPIQDKPRRPTFASAGSAGETMTRYNDDGFSTNDVTITDLKAR